HSQLTASPVLRPLRNNPVFQLVYLDPRIRHPCGVGTFTADRAPGPVCRRRVPVRRESLQPDRRNSPDPGRAALTGSHRDRALSDSTAGHGIVVARAALAGPAGQAVRAAI